MPVAVPFKNFDKSVPEVLDALGARNPLAGVSRILLKPNLVTIQPHPVTTAPEFCQAVIRHLRSFTDAEIVIAEGTGDPPAPPWKFSNNWGQETGRGICHDTH
ncbi:MAG: DUF362 domain-containing protein [Desulfobacterales bacterium]